MFGLVVFRPQYRDNGVNIGTIAIDGHGCGPGPANSHTYPNPNLHTYPNTLPVIPHSNHHSHGYYLAS